MLASSTGLFIASCRYFMVAVIIDMQLAFVYIAPSIIHPPNDSYIVTVNSLSSVQLMCSLNVTIPSSMTVTWSHNGNDIMTPPNEVSTTGSTTTLVIRNLQPSDAGVYQCVFNDSVNGWMMRRNITGNHISIHISVHIGPCTW